MMATRDFCDLMTIADDEKKRPPHPRAPQRSRRKTSASFDLWLARGLHQMFDDVASEPIPSELLKLIEDDQQK